MLGLNVTLRSRQSVFAGLSKEMVLVSAGVSLRTTALERDHPASYFHCTGMDDRNDDVRWFLGGPTRVGTFVEIEVADHATSDVPMSSARKRMNWHQFFGEMKKRDRSRLIDLERRLSRVRKGMRHVESWKETRPPRGGVRVSLNGKTLARTGVGDPGTLSVSVYGQRRESRSTVKLAIHGGERLGKSVWRWYRWSWNETPLTLGDVVRIEIVPPRQLRLGNAGPVEVQEPQTEKEILSAIDRLKSLKSKSWYKKETADMVAVSKLRPPQRRYPRKAK